MNINCILPDVKILNVEKKSNYDGSINWYEVVIFQDSTCNTVTCDTKTAEALKVGSNYHLFMNISEQPKSYKNGGGAYMASKFKITGIVSK